MNRFKINNPKQTKSVLIIVLIFVIISFAYLPPCLFGKMLDVSDYNLFTGASKELKDFRNATGEEALWTNSMFGGMPAYLILTNYKGSIFQPYFRFISLIPRPVNYLIINFCMFFILGLLLGANPWISFAGSLTFGFSTYLYILLGEGHITKVQSITYFPLLIAGIYLLYNKRPLPGSIISVVGLSLILSINHMQMSYYAIILVLIMIITYFIHAWKEKALAGFFKASGLLTAAVILAVGISFGPILTTYEYSKYSTRGKSDLKEKEYNKTSGLNRDFILDFSYDFREVFTAFIPRFRGGSNSEPLNKDTETYRLLLSDQGKLQAENLIKSVPLYWGDQPMARGPFYYGAVLCFLFILGLFIVKGKEKWWIVAVVFLSFLLSLGKNLPFLSNLMIDNFPGYNKFRGVTNIIVIQHFAMAFMGLLTIREIYLRNIDSEKFYRSLKYSFAIAGGFALMFTIIPGLAGSFKGSYDSNLTEMGWPQQFINALVHDRKSILRLDSFRTFIFVSLAAVALWVFWARKVKPQYLLIFWVFLILADLWPVDKKYLNSDSFVSRKRAEITYLPTNADKIILQDKDPDYRVLNLSLDPFTDTSTSYYHKSLGGNNGAKMRRYQDMIYFNITREIKVMLKQLENATKQDVLDSLLATSKSINLLNTRYIIFSPDAAPVINRHALGNAWFADNYRIADNADEEVRAIKDLKIDSEVVIDRRFENYLSGKTFRKDSISSIKLVSYAPNRLVYRSASSSQQLAVFSEIYYPKGWISRIDGIETPHFRVNYILRSMVVPAGNHEIIFEFKPQSYKTGNTVSLASSIVFIIAVAGAGFSVYNKRQ